MCIQEENSVHLELCYSSIINPEAVLIFREKHALYEDKCCVYCFISLTNTKLRNMLSTKQHSCLKKLKMQLVGTELWELVLFNMKHILRSVLNPSNYMHSQRFVQSNIKCIFGLCVDTWLCVWCGTLPECTYTKFEKN